jgi:predicted enzyme related to lactoylglutathione lyase
MNRVVHFEIHAINPEQAAKFYRNVFGWEIKEWIVPGVQIPEENRYWMVTTGSENKAGINGGMVVRRGPAPAEGQAVNAYVCTIEVASIDEFIEKAVSAGAVITIPKMPIKGVGWLAYCKDPDGNIFGMMQNDENAS